MGRSQPPQAEAGKKVGLADSEPNKQFRSPVVPLETGPLRLN